MDEVLLPFSYVALYSIDISYRCLPHVKHVLDMCRDYFIL